MERASMPTPDFALVSGDALDTSRVQGPSTARFASYQLCRATPSTPAKQKTRASASLLQVSSSNSFSKLRAQLALSSPPISSSQQSTVTFIADGKHA
ncbi:hypothetical protein CBOM_02212 [Ceraceosorus bombacis]|uniref:Uncharacterized protein n=1 Tax=Ceraceosorus bombacis TaxID=401625 RepID=A0A0P1BEN4_9BASI|nr:hypothetical protein CBOM_02212 [Ceraceosorus bombacis]